MNDDNAFQLSRRSVLAGLGTVGLASAGAGLGTTAFFSDREDFTDNRMVAGELDLKVDWKQWYYGASESMDLVNQYPASGTINTRDDIATTGFGSDFENLSSENQTVVEAQFRDQFADVPDDFSGPLIQLDDVKPGDRGKVCFSLHLFDNPGYIWFGGELTENAENGINEPESKDPDEDGTSRGELADEVMVTAYYDLDGDCEFDGGTDALIFEDLSLADAMNDLANAGGYVPLDADPGTGGQDCFVNSTTYYVVLEWELPVDHANEIQSDSVAADLFFYTEQCRHNDGTSPDINNSTN